MTVLITGAGGFVGRHVAQTLLDRGRAVRGLDLAWPEDMPDIECHTGSILDSDAVAAAVRGATEIIHCAALANLWIPRAVEYDWVNVAGTCRIAAAARRTGARLIHVSSYMTLIGRAPPPVVDETVEIPPNRLLGRYPRSKRQAELAALAAGAAGVPVTVVLPTAPIGPGDTRLTPPTAMIRDLAAGRTPALIDCRLNLIDVAALAEGIASAARQGRPNTRYLLAGTDISLPDLAAKIAARTGRPAPKARVPIAVALAAARAEALLSRLTKRPPKAPLTGVRLAARPVGFDTRRAQQDLGFRPPPIDTALDRALDWLRTAGHLD